MRTRISMLALVFPAVAAGRGPAASIVLRDGETGVVEGIRTTSMTKPMDLDRAARGAAALHRRDGATISQM